MVSGYQSRQTERTEPERGPMRRLALIQVLGNEGVPVNNFKLLVACELPLSW